MAVSFGAASTIVIPAQNPGSITPTMPASVAAGNLLILYIGIRNDTATVATPTGWTALGNVAGGGGTAGASAGPSRVYAFTRTATGSGDTLGAITLTGASVAFAQVLRFANATGLWDVAASSGSDSVVGTAWSVTGDVNPGITAGDYAVVATVSGQAAATWSGQAVSATGVTVWGTAVEVNEINSTTGNDINGYISYHPVTTGTATAAPVITATAAGTTTNTRGVSILVRAREAAPPAPTVDAGLDDDHLVNTAFTRTAGETGSSITARSWTLQSGPGVTPGTSIGTAAALSWTPTTAGTYGLRYSATNATGTGTDDVTIYVEANAAVNDTFTRTSSTDPGTADTGQKWIARQGTWGTNGTQAYCVSALENDLMTVLVGSATQTVRCSMAVSQNWWGLVGRYEPGAAGPTEYIALWTTDGLGSIYRAINNVYTLVVQTAAGTVAAGSLIELSIAEETTPTVGTRLILKDDGVQVLNTLDTATTRPQGIRAGIQAGDASGNAGRWDDFQVNYTGSETHTTTGTASATASATRATTTNRVVARTASATATATRTVTSTRTTARTAAATATATGTTSSSRAIARTATATATASRSTSSTRVTARTAQATATASAVSGQSPDKVTARTATATATASATTTTTRAQTGTASATASTSRATTTTRTTSRTASATATATRTDTTARTTTGTATATATATRTVTSTRATARTATATATATGSTIGPSPNRTTTGTATATASASRVTTTTRPTARTATATATAARTTTTARLTARTAQATATATRTGTSSRSTARTAQATATAAATVTTVRAVARTALATATASAVTTQRGPTGDFEIAWGTTRTSGPLTANTVRAPPLLAARTTVATLTGSTEVT